MSRWKPRRTIRTLASEPVGAGAAAIWLACLERLADRSAHEIKNPLNGLSLNLEVVRSRSAKPGVDGSQIAPYAAAASSELERTLGLVDALLLLARPPSIPVDLRTVVKPLSTLYGAIAVAGGGSLEVVAESEQMFVDPDGVSVRALVAGVLDAVLVAGAKIEISLEARGDDIHMRVLPGTSRPLAPDLERLAADRGIRLSVLDEEVLLLFPARAHTGVDSKR